MSEWQPIETAPKGIYLLLLQEGKHVIGKFIERFSEENPLGDGDCEEFDQENERHTLLEGWYERLQNWDTYDLVRMVKSRPTHWMPLPEPLK